MRSWRQDQGAQHRKNHRKYVQYSYGLPRIDKTTWNIIRTTLQTKIYEKSSIFPYLELDSQWDFTRIRAEILSKSAARAQTKVRSTVKITGSMYSTRMDSLKTIKPHVTLSGQLYRSEYVKMYQISLTLSRGSNGISLVSEPNFDQNQRLEARPRCAAP